VGRVNYGYDGFGMLPNMRVWDKEKIEALFPLHVANRIIETPLINVVEDDKLLWSDSIDGNYSVKSGYKVVMNDTRRAGDLEHNGDWLGLWKIKAPQKAKHLLWRICRGCLPTRLRLQEKHVNCQLSCPLCNHDVEDDWHAFISCDVSVQACQAAGLNHVLARHIQQAPNIMDLIFKVCSVETAELAGAFAMLVWVLWQNRNSKVWTETQEPGRILGAKSRYLWEEWHAVQQVQHSGQHTVQQQHVIRWEKPQQGWYKCNIDAAFHANLNKTSTGWCLRDHLGRFIMAETTWLDGNYSVLEGEAIALLEAMRAMKDRRISYVIFETDSKCVVDAIQHLRGGNSEFRLLVSHINTFLAFDQHFVVKFTK
jgi:hypothetical protein